MEKVYIIYWSGTGNTEKMAYAVAEGAKAAGAEVELWNVDEADINQIKDAKAIALGCPSMGSEQLEESCMEPFMCELDGLISKKTVALFGSYGWGNGEWMRDWEGRIVTDGATLLNAEGIIANGEPSEDIVESCKLLGEELANR